MPKSKRNKIVHLSKTKKKNKEWKEGLVTTVRKSLDSYPAVYLFKYYNMRNEKFKELREELKDSSRFIMGSNKVLQVALGKTASDEYKDNLHQLSERLKGCVGLFFTNLPREEVVKMFESYSHQDYARPGTRATEDFCLLEGPLEGPMGPLPHTLEPQLRKHGLPTKLNKGVVELVAEHTVCREGRPLDANQAALLRIFDVKMAVFHFKLLAAWTADGDRFEELADDEDSEDGGGEGALQEGGFTFPEDMEMGLGQQSDDDAGSDADDS